MQGLCMCHISRSNRSASTAAPPFHCFLADNADDAATLRAAAGPAQAASGAVVCAASAAVACGAGAESAAHSHEDRFCGAHGHAIAHPEGHGQAHGEATAMGLCGPAPKDPRMERWAKLCLAIRKADRGPPNTTSGVSESHSTRAEGAALNRWPGSKRCRRGGHAPGGLQGLLGTEPFQDLQFFVNLFRSSSRFYMHALGFNIVGFAMFCYVLLCFAYRKFWFPPVLLPQDCAGLCILFSACPSPGISKI